MTLSRNQVDKLGSRLRGIEVPTDDDLRLLSTVRESRRAAMDAAGAVLAEITGHVPARRLKTTNSIVAKLRRERNRLSAMQDIAGLRVVREMTRADQDDLVVLVVRRLPDAKVVDRRAKPSHGYRAVHVVVAVDGHPVEIQVRTELQHRWAVMVERLAAAWGQQIKYGRAPDEPDAMTAAGESRRGVVRSVSLMATFVMHVEQADAEIAHRVGLRLPADGDHLDDVREAVLEMRAEVVGRLGEIHDLLV